MSNFIHHEVIGKKTIARSFTVEFDYVHDFTVPSRFSEIFLVRQAFLRPVDARAPQ